MKIYSEKVKEHFGFIYETEEKRVVAIEEGVTLFLVHFWPSGGNFSYKMGSEFVTGESGRK